MIQPLESDRAAQLLLIAAMRSGTLRVARRKNETALHMMADLNAPALQRLVQVAINASRNSLDRQHLQDAVRTKNRDFLLGMADQAVAVMQTHLERSMHHALTTTAVSGGHVAAKMLRVKQPKALRTLASVRMKFDASRPEAAAWAQKHAATLVQNISKTTRERIRNVITDVLQGEETLHDAEDRITDAVGDEARAETIARTEVMRAVHEGQRQAWAQAEDEGLLTGNELREWIATGDACPLCQDLDGQTAPLDGTFESDGEQVDGPPLHPNCRCTEGLTVQ